jgi:teichuronic acid biosynthesis glycosyltransferase TuaC
MHLLVFTNLYPRSRNLNHGAFVHRQVKMLQTLGHTVTVISPVPWSPKVLEFNARWRQYAEVPAAAIIEGVQVFYPRYLRLPGAWFRPLAAYTMYLGARPMVRRLHREAPFDLVHSHFLLSDGLAGLWLARMLSIPSVCTGHGADVNTIPAETPFNHWSVKHVMRHTDQIIAISEDMRQTMGHLETAAQPAVNYLGVNLGEFAAQTPDHRATEATILTPFILFVGVDVRRKGLPVLLEAYSRLADSVPHKLVVIGATPAQLKALAPELTVTLGSKLVPLGTLAPERIPPFSAACELLVLPSYSEGLPIGVLEAMAAGRPVIATNVNGIPEAVQDGKTGFLVGPGDPDALHHALEHLLNTPGLADEMGRRGQEYVSLHFSAQEHSRRLVSIYRTLLADLETAVRDSNGKATSD